MDYESLVARVLDRGSATVVEVLGMLEYDGIAIDGDAVLFYPYEPVVMWSGLSDEAGEALQRLAADERLQVIPTHPLTYAYDGTVLTLKVANPESILKGYKYKTQRWLPVEFRKRPAA